MRSKPRNILCDIKCKTLKSAKPRGYSSAGRAPALQAGGHRFDPDYLHQRKPERLGVELVSESARARFGLIAQVVRAHA